MSEWDDIIEEHGPKVWRQALRMVGNEADAADCFQKVMLEAFEASQGSAILNWQGYLKKVTAFRALDLLRKRYRDRTESLPAGDVVAPAAAAEPLEMKELRDRLRQELARLPKDQAEALTLRLIEGLTGEEAAAHMGIEVGHVAVLVFRARQTLRQRLNPEEL